MDIFEIGKVPDTTIAGASQALARAAGRFVLSMVRSLRYLEPAAVEHFRNLLTPQSLWVLAIILAGWALATLVGGPIALVINGLLGAYGLYQIYEQLALTWQNLKSWALTAYRAQNEAQIEEAARFFASAVTDGVLTLLEVILTHRVFKSVEAGLKKRYPAPAWLQAEYDRAISEAGQKRTKRTEEASRAKNEEASRAKENARQAKDKESPSRRAGEDRAPLPPPPPAGNSLVLPTILGVVAAVGTGTAIAFALAETRRTK